MRPGTDESAETPSREPLRFITCGSVDDGKSTLIGRLLFESRSIFDDQLAALTSDSRRYGTQGDRRDYALLLDGLQAEREQGITIDVAYRYFTTARRSFIIADTPGHEQYTRNMATGASTAQLAVILVDARKGVLTQTRRHARIVSMMGVRHLVLAINKMDLVDYSQALFERLVAEFTAWAAAMGFESLQAIPLSALEGDNLVDRSPRTPWYTGPTFRNHLETIDVTTAGNTAKPLRLPVQMVSRPNLDFRGFSGRIAAGHVRPGDRVRVLPVGVATTVKAIVVWPGERSEAHAGDSVTLTLADAVDVSRGDVIVADRDPPDVADQFEAKLIWMSEDPLLAGRSYRLKLHAQEVTATITSIEHQLDIDSGSALATKTLTLNQIAVVKLTVNRPVVFEPYSVNAVLGGFILIDQLSNETVGAGMLEFSLRRATNIRWQTLSVNKAARANLGLQQPRCLWFTGLSGSGKSTIANLLESRLHAEGRHTYLLDGDNVRHGLNRDLGFTAADRVENVRRVAEVAKLMVDAGLIVIVALIAPFSAERRMARALFGEREFIEIFVDAPLALCESRDPKGLYAKARRGELPNFTGIDSAYERPEAPEVHLHADVVTPAEAVAQVLEQLRR